jgi:hypothetical protein
MPSIESNFAHVMSPSLLQQRYGTRHSFRSTATAAAAAVTYRHCEGSPPSPSIEAAATASGSEAFYSTPDFESRCGGERALA